MSVSVPAPPQREAGETSSAPLGQPIRGPRALAGDWRRFWHLTLTIARNEFKLKFFGSALGYLWQLMRPLMLFGVLYIVFAQLVNIGGRAPHFPVVILSGIVLYGFFSEATTGAVTSVLTRENLVRKIEFPRLVIPLAVVLTGLFNLGLNLVAVVVFMFIQGVHPQWTWLELPLLVAVLAVFAAGVAMLLSALYVRYRDVQPIWDVVIQILFYVSLILFPLEKLQGQGNVPLTHISLDHAVLVNPLAMVNQEFRHALIDPHAASAAHGIGGVPELLIPLGLVAATFALGFWVFNRSAPVIAEEL